jgi:hypothetical protein
METRLRPICPASDHVNANVAQLVEQLIRKLENNIFLNNEIDGFFSIFQGSILPISMTVPDPMNAAGRSLSDGSIRAESAPS